MNFLNKLGLAIAAMAVVAGSAFARTADQNSNPGPPSPDAAFSESRLLSFADILDLGVGADHQMATEVVDAASRAPVESSAQSGGIYDLLLALSDRPDATGSVFGADSSPDSSVIDLPTLLIPGAHAAPVQGTTEPGTTDKPMSDGFLFSVAAIPEPGDWMTLLCGFVVVAFMARRKTSAVAD